jgi:hypothetical protein
MDSHSPRMGCWSILTGFSLTNFIQEYLWETSSDFSFCCFIWPKPPCIRLEFQGSWPGSPRTLMLSITPLIPLTKG